MLGLSTLKSKLPSPRRSPARDTKEPQGTRGGPSLLSGWEVSTRDGGREGETLGEPRSLVKLALEAQAASRSRKRETQFRNSLLNALKMSWAPCRFFFFFFFE